MYWWHQIGNMERLPIGSAKFSDHSWCVDSAACTAAVASHQACCKPVPGLADLGEGSPWVPSVDVNTLLVFSWRQNSSCRTTGCTQLQVQAVLAASCVGQHPQHMAC